MPQSIGSDSSAASGAMPEAEVRRLGKLLEYDILDSAPEALYDDVVQVAARLFKTSISAVSLVDRDRQWFKAKVGLAASETPRSMAFCQHAIKSDEVFVVEDARSDPLFAANPLVTGNPNIRFYAGAPLVTPDGFRLGTLCVIDDAPRAAPDDDAKTVLKMLARLVMREMENRKLAARAQQHARMMSRLAEAVIEITRARDVAQVVELTLAAALRLLVADAAHLEIKGLGGHDQARTLQSPDSMVTPGEFKTVNWSGAGAQLASRRAFKAVTADQLRGANGGLLPKGAWTGFLLGAEADHPIGHLQVWRRMTSSFMDFETAILTDLGRVAAAVIERLAARG